MGRLCQGVGKVPNGKGKRIEGTNTFFAIKFENIPKDRLNEICYTSVVCEVRPGKKDPNRTRITICGTNVCYPGDVGTNTSSLEPFKLTINSVLSRKGAKYVCFDISQHTTWKTRICKDSVVKNSRITYQRIQPHQLGAQRLGIFQNPSWMLWITPIWNSGKQTTQIEIRKGRLL